MEWLILSVVTVAISDMFPKFVYANVDVTSTNRKA